MRLLWRMLVVMAAWLATIPDSSVSASITIAITSAQLALAAAGLGAASVAGLGLVLKTKKKEKGSYGAPETSYGAPESSYEAPESSYEAPETSYEAPEASYTAPETSYISPGAQLDLQKGPNSFNAEDTAFFPSDNAKFFPQDNSEILSSDETGSDAQKLPTGSPRYPKKLSLNLESESNDENNFPRQKRQRNTKNKHHPHLQPRRQPRGGLMDLPRLTLQSLHTLPARYRDYAARMQRFRIGGLRNPQLEFRMRVRRSAEGTKLKTQGRRDSSQNLDFGTLFQSIGELDAADCGKVYVCEVAATPLPLRSEGDAAVLDLIAVAGHRREAAEYRWAANVGRSRGVPGCREAFPRCPLTGLKDVVAASL